MGAASAPLACANSPMVARKGGQPRRRKISQLLPIQSETYCPPLPCHVTTSTHSSTRSNTFGTQDCRSRTASLCKPGRQTGTYHQKLDFDFVTKTPHTTQNSNNTTKIFKHPNIKKHHTVPEQLHQTIIELHPMPVPQPLQLLGRRSTRRRANPNFRRFQ